MNPRLLALLALASGLLLACSSSPDCKGTSVLCGGACVELASDNRSCGACGNACSGGTTCIAGACSLTCRTGQLACAGACVDPASDRAHCGASGDCAGANAGQRCAAGQVCSAGACALSCQTGLVDCGGACVDPMTSAAFCGAAGDCAGPSAGSACRAGEACSGGVCALSCPGGLVACGGTCVNPLTDRAFCGASADCAGANAGQACTAGRVCTGGGCAVSCLPGQVECGGTCVDPRTDRGHCGASVDCAGAHAGKVCASGQVCAAGACAVSCQTDQVECNGACVDPLGDRGWCGASADCSGTHAGKVCAAGQVCAAGACAASCPPGQVACSGACVSPLTDRTFCGASADCANANSGKTCPAGEVCAAGVCAPTCLAGEVECGGSGGTCVSPLTDRAFCGASGDCAGANAGNRCQPGEICQAGLCAPSCPAGQLFCGGGCVSPLSDRAFCGASGDCANANAGKSCNQGEVCANGSCAVSCPANQLQCGTSCISPLTDRAFCGASGDCANANAGKICNQGEVCTNGNCAVSCPGSELVCGGACVDPKTDRSFCGASLDCLAPHAGASCGAGQICSNGVCTGTCASNQISCNGACVDPATDFSFCGASGDCLSSRAGVACGPLEDCASGSCTAAATALDLATPFSTDLALPFANAVQPAGLGYLPTAVWNGRAAPLPTNAWWKYFAVGTGQQRVDAVPYQLKALPAGLALSLQPVQASATLVSVADTQQLLFGSAQGFTGHVITAFDALSVTLRYTASAGTMTLPVVPGMPYVTADYAGLTPKVVPGQNGLFRVNGAATTPVTGTRFQLTLGDGSNWLLYASSAITFSWSSAAGLTATAPFTGTLRAANLPAGATAAVTAVLDAHAAAIPRSGSFQVGVGGDLARLQFAWATTGSGPLLTMAMPHHRARLRSPVLPGLAYGSLHGQLQAVEGSAWLMKIPLSPIGFYAPRPIAASRVAAVQAALNADAGYVPPLSTLGDPYFGGKYLAKLARLALIADELGDTANAASLRARLDPLSAAWLDGTNTGNYGGIYANGNPLLYDTSWGGVVTTVGLGSESNDFGQGHYNDHHFHYGYHLFAAAALIKANPSFAVAHKKGLYALVRDIANPSTSDPGFPQLRNFDLFAGHSWASGLRTSGSESSTGNDQESSSEAVNAWYGLQALGLSLGDQRMADLGRLLLAMEIDAARTYYQIPLASTVYPAVFAQNRCVGQLFSAQATFQTFFGSEPYKVYGIQMIPFTPASELLINPAWINDAWASKLSPAAASAVAASSGFGGLLYLSHATIDKATAWTEVNAAGVDDGNSLTNSLWWVATRP